MTLLTKDSLTSRATLWMTGRRRGLRDLSFYAVDEEGRFRQRLFVTRSFLRSRLERPEGRLTLVMSKRLVKMVDEGGVYPIVQVAASAPTPAQEEGAVGSAESESAEKNVASVEDALRLLGATPKGAGDERRNKGCLPNREEAGAMSAAATPAPEDSDTEESPEKRRRYSIDLSEGAPIDERVAKMKAPLGDSRGTADALWRDEPACAEFEACGKGVLEGLIRYADEGGEGALLTWAKSDSSLFGAVCCGKSSELRTAFTALLAPLIRASGMSKHLYDAVRQLDRPLAQLLGNLKNDGHVLDSAKGLRSFLGASKEDRTFRSLSSSYADDVKPAPNKPAERICAVTFDVRQQLKRVADSTMLLTLIVRSLLDMVEKKLDPELLLVPMFDAAMAHKSVIRGNVKHSDLIFKLRNL